MPKPPKLRRVLKWCGLVLCLLVIGAWAITAMTTKELERIIPQNKPVAVVADGCVVVWTYRPSEPHDELALGGQEQVTREGFTLPKFRKHNQPGFYFTVTVVPLWLALVVIATPTALLWYRDRKAGRHPPGHCQKCGYNLTGNVSGICPECETKVPKNGG